LDVTEKKRDWGGESAGIGVDVTYLATAAEATVAWASNTCGGRANNLVTTALACVRVGKDSDRHGR
jgi:hypothetical protein